MLCVYFELGISQKEKMFQKKWFTTLVFDNTWCKVDYSLKNVRTLAVKYELKDK
jgi:hypothetical protein